MLAAVRRITEPPPAGLGISQRSVTVSTVGLVPAIKRLADEGLSVRLAVSLHAPDDELRDELVPVNRRWQVAEVLDAAWGYAAATGRRVSIEYAMIRDINDQAWRADLLASLLAGRLAHVNLIPLNPTPGSKWTASDPGVADEFLDRLASRGVPVTVRDTRGDQIDGACGQLAAAAPAERLTGQHSIFQPVRRQGTFTAMTWKHDLGKRRRALTAGLVQAAWRRMQQAGTVTAESAAGRRFAAFGPGSLMAFPTGVGLRRALDRDRRPVHDRRAGHAVRGHGPRPRSRP